VEHLEVDSTVNVTDPDQCECGFEFAMLKAASEKLNFTFKCVYTYSAAIECQSLIPF
jgi:hypothetical protein